MNTGDMWARPSDLKEIPISDRYVDQHQQLGVRNVYDALIELITNSDDRYVFLEQQGQKINGRIEIEVERKRTEASGIIRVRDFADGMTSIAMKRKLLNFGDRVSGMAEDVPVRGTNSRGAKDVALLGKAQFECIAEDGHYHKCEIWPPKYYSLEKSIKATDNIRKKLGIPGGTGTLVTVTVKPTYPTPNHKTLKKRLGDRVELRDILSERTIILQDLKSGHEDEIKAPNIEGKEHLKESFYVPGYPGAKAKLIIKRAKKRLDNRQGGVLIKSRRAIHETTYFDQSLGHDPHALWFFGKLTCKYIDKLWNEYDERFEKKIPHPPENPCHVVDPLRKTGLRREHPFTKILFREALKRFRPLVEAERKQQEKQRSKIESEHTRKRLNALERAAAKFMEKHVTEEEATLKQDSRKADSVFKKKGFSLNPPFAQILIGHSCHFWLNINQTSFPEFSVGDLVEIACLTKEISSGKAFASLETHPNQEGVLQSKWLVKGESPSRATGVQVRIGRIVTDSTIEVLESERQKYEHIRELCFNRKKYSVVTGKAKSVKILAPYSEIINKQASINVECTNPAFKIMGERILKPQPNLGVAICKLRVLTEEPEQLATLEARIEGHSATTQLVSVLARGSPINIEFYDGDFENQRFRWDGNTLEIATKHPSVGRYLGEKPDYKGQEEKHFRAILAEIVAEAVCQRVMSKKEAEEPEEYENADWDTYYADYTRLMTEFLPIAHELQISAP